MVFLGCSYGQDQKYSPQQLQEDLHFLKKTLLDAHANPYTELTKGQYIQLFDSMETAIKDSADAITFYKLIRPAFAYLSDEHADISVNSLGKIYSHDPVFLPFTLIKQGDVYSIDRLLLPQAGLEKGETIIAINAIPIAGLVQDCSV